MFRILKFILPLAFWCFLLRDFLSGAIPLNMDTNTIYGVTKYYFNNLFNGVIPLWEPFVGLGRPFYAIAICNLFNPATQLIALLKVLGLNYNTAFIIYMVVYFWIGCIGFYFLTKQILKDTRLAYLGYLAFMFSSLGVSMFTQLTFLEIVVPSIWFFYFLIMFAQEQKQGHFLGLVLSIMIVLSAYLPFYFLTVVGVFLLMYAILYPQLSWVFVKNTMRFNLSHWKLCLVCVIGILAAAGPLLAYKMLDATGDSVSPGRHCQYASAQECYDGTMNQKGGMSYKEITQSGGLGERLDLGYLFSHLDKITYGSDSLFFVPIWVYMILGMTVFLRLNRRTVLLAGMMLMIALIALGNAAGVHQFLYEHVFFFAYFRNLFFFGAFLIPLIILLALVQLQILLAFKFTNVTQTKMIILGIVMAHGLFFMFLSQYEGMMMGSLLSVCLSALFFVLHYAGLLQRFPTVLMALGVALLILQPAEVMKAYATNAIEFKCILPSNHVVPSFSWQRPLKPAMSMCRIYQFVHYEDFWYAMNMTDAPAKIGYPQSAARWTFALSQKMGDDVLGEYARYKVYLYQQGKVKWVDGPSQELDVSHFDVNQIVFRTKFKQRTFMVYNDSYTTSWQAWMDGQRIKLERANEAFKGVWVEAGEHQVEFKYSPPGGGWVYVLAIMFILAFCIGTIMMLYWRR